MNNLTIAGNLGADCRFNPDAGGRAVCNFTVAVRSHKKDSEGKNLTDWFDCDLWGKQAEIVSPFLTKGTKATVCGSVGVDSYEKNGQFYPKLVLHVNSVTLQGSMQNRMQPQPQQQQQTPNQQQQQHHQQAQQQQGQQAQQNNFNPDDIPF